CRSRPGGPRSWSPPSWSSAGAWGPVRGRQRRRTAPGGHRQVSQRRVRVRVGRAAAHGGQRRHRGAPAAPGRARARGGPDLPRATGHDSPNIRRLDILHHEVQQGIKPQAVALAILGGLAALALLVLAGQGMAQLLERSTRDLTGLRAMGTSRAQAALASGLAGAVAVLGGTALAVAGAVAVSPLAPVGAVREFDPARGVRADPLVLAGG